MFHQASHFIMLLWLVAIINLGLKFIKMVEGRPGVADPVKPCYDHSLFHTFYERPQIPDDLYDIKEYKKRGGAGHHVSTCMTNTWQPAHIVNRIFENYDLDYLKTQVNYIGDGVTYWINDYLHVGHVHYDIALIQIFSMIKVQRIVMQRAACHARLCDGIGSMESFYKGYYTALVEAFNQTDVPVYIRYHAREQELIPLYFSSHSPTYYKPKPSNLVINSTEEIRYRPMPLQTSFCFDQLVRRGDYKYGAIPSVSVRAVKAFKASAYKMLQNSNLTSFLPPLTTYFPSLDPPYRILFSFRGPLAPSRKIANQESFVTLLQKHFPSPTYELLLLNNSDPNLYFYTQLHAVANAHVVITNHGAFEGNMIYMKNSSLLIEIFGDYGNNEIHTFHRLALMFGVFYARVHPKDMVDHLAPSFTLADEEMTEIVDMVSDYFNNKRFKPNTLVK
jgi:hypothetical protein